METAVAAIAVVIWALVASEPELSTFATVRLEYKNLPEELEISSGPVSSVCSNCAGPPANCAALGDGDSSGRGARHVGRAKPASARSRIGDGNVKLARGVRLVRAIPSEVRFQFEPRRIRTVPVQVRFTGEGQNGYEVAQSITWTRRKWTSSGRAAAWRVSRR